MKLLRSIWFFMPIRFGVVAAGVAAGAASIAGSAISSSSSGDAADQQAQASRDANAANLKINEDQLKYLRESRDMANAQQEPFRQTGLAGNNQLAYLLGLQNRFKTVSTGAKPKPFKPVDAKSFTLDDWRNVVSKKTGSPVDPNAPVNMANFKKWQDQSVKLANENLKKQSIAATQKKVLNNDANFGSLNKDFSEKFVDTPFTEKFVDKPFKFEEDPGYQYRKEQGNRDLQGRLAAMGMTNSGAALKEGMRVNQGLADQAYGDAFNRYQTNRNFDYNAYGDRRIQSNANRGFRYNAFTDRYNQYQSNRNTKFNQIAGIAGTGQQAANQISSNNANFGQSASAALGQRGQFLQDNITNIGNARAANSIAQGNAWQQGLSGVGQAVGGLAGYSSAGNGNVNTSSLNNSLNNYFKW
jgi:hypothetical protein